MIHHYPLQWPTGWPKTKGLRIPGAFKVDYDTTIRELDYEVEKLGASSAYISTDQELRVNGTPRRDRPPISYGVALYITRHGQPLCIPCDKFNSVRDNIRAVMLTIRNIRQMERYGTNQMIEAALSGFAALPSKATEMPAAPRTWHEVLGVLPDSPASVIRAAYRAKALTAHPDKGGSATAWQELQNAYEESGAA